ncbi:unnamed protein product (mitochondrion) [Plasmodiophora brassicae]|uniref:G-protein coupled receptors family 1 profile domain-containing protein n=1 Tax=Plasmodiophora brassicae TaxID=37360 RepID=A0A0G4ISZ3_PLABS|nr:hypothetical protein PBRA_006373 [Plasmodiophora brassicae]SPQ95166.1 unnamed protein product [Plasmodiophora brassicae]
MEFEFVAQIASAVSAPLVSVQFALLVCVSVTVWRTGLRKATGVLRCQFGASLFATISSTSILLQYSVPWTPDMNPLWCELNSRATPFFYAWEFTFVLQFLLERLKCVQPDAAQSLVVKVLQLGIIGIIPVAFGIMPVIRGTMVFPGAVCIASAPTSVFALFDTASIVVSGILISRFHWAVVEVSRRRRELQPVTNNTGYSPESLYRMATRNAVSSIVAMSCTVTTFTIYLVVNVAVVDRLTSWAIVAELCGLIDMLVNVLVLFMCSIKWMPAEFRNFFGQYVQRKGTPSQQVQANRRVAPSLH